jgi:hypothetical protein
MPEFIEAISIVPPWMADTTAASPPSTPPGNRLTLILPPDLACTISANFSMPITSGWPLGFCVVNLMVFSCAKATPKAEIATAAARVLSIRRFMGCLLKGKGKGGCTLLTEG